MTLFNALSSHAARRAGATGRVAYAAPATQAARGAIRCHAAAVQATAPLRWEDIPALRAWPVVGSLPSLLKHDRSPDKVKFHEAVTTMHEQLGGVFKAKINSAYSDWTLFVADPQVATDLMLNDARAPFRPATASWVYYRQQNNYPLGVTSSNGEDWRRIRSAAQDIVMKPQLLAKTFLHCVDEPTLLLVDHMGKAVRAAGSDAAKGNANVDIDRIVQRWSIDAQCRIVLGESIGVQDDPPNPLANRMITAMAGFFGPSSGAMRQPAIAWKYGLTELGRTHMAAVHEFHEVCGVIMDLALKNFASHPEKLEGTFLGYLMSHQDALTQDEILATVADFIQAGIDTLSRTILTTFYLLGRNPDVQERLRAEVFEVAGPSGPVTKEHLAQFKFMKNVIKESMRLYPVLPMHARIPQTDIVAGGVCIPAQTESLIQLWSMARNPNLVQDPLTFNPDRWLNKRGGSASAAVEESIHPGISMPFGAGSRMCLGRRIAEMELYTVMTYVLRNFELCASPDELDLVFGLGLASRTATPVRFRPLRG